MGLGFSHPDCDCDPYERHTCGGHATPVQVHVVVKEKTPKWARMLMRQHEAELAEARGLVFRLLNEVDCRIEHGADSGGHLEYVRKRLKKIIRRIDA